jgi:hypothetical protein
MLHSRHRQRGQSAWGSLFMIGMLLFLAISVMKLWGAYYADYSVGKVVASMESDASLRGKSPKEITELLIRRLEVNSVTLDPKEIKVTRSDRGTQLVVSYERRVPMFGNLDGVARFSHTATLGGGSR